MRVITASCLPVGSAEFLFTLANPVLQGTLLPLQPVIDLFRQCFSSGEQMLAVCRGRHYLPSES